MKFFYKTFNNKIVSEFTTIPELDGNVSFDVKFFEGSLRKNSQILPPPTSGFNYIIGASIAPDVNITNLYEDPFSVMVLPDYAQVVWETFNEYVYDYVDKRCQSQGFRDYKDVVDSATNTFLPSSEQQEAQDLRNWWGRVWTEAYDIRDNQIFAALQKSEILTIKQYIDQLDAIV